MARDSSLVTFQNSDRMGGIPELDVRGVCHTMAPVLSLLSHVSEASEMINIPRLLRSVKSAVLRAPCRSVVKV